MPKAGQRATVQKLKQQIFNIRMKKYAIKLSTTIEEIINRKILQNNSCAICKRDFDLFKHNNIHIDHCHKRNKFRGWLCRACNIRLGWYEKHKEVINNYIK